MAKTKFESTNSKEDEKKLKLKRLNEYFVGSLKKTSVRSFVFSKKIFFDFDFFFFLQKTKNKKLLDELLTSGPSSSSSSSSLRASIGKSNNNNNNIKKKDRRAKPHIRLASKRWNPRTSADPMHPSWSARVKIRARQKLLTQRALSSSSSSSDEQVDGKTNENKLRGDYFRFDPETGERMQVTSAVGNTSSSSFFSEAFQEQKQQQHVVFNIFDPNYHSERAIQEQQFREARKERKKLKEKRYKEAKKRKMILEGGDEMGIGAGSATTPKTTGSSKNNKKQRMKLKKRQEAERLLKEQQQQQDAEKNKEE